MTNSSINSGLYIYGAGGHGRVIADSARRAGFQDLTFVDDQPKGTELQGCPIVATGALPATTWMGRRFIVAIGTNEIRSKVFLRLLALGGVPTSVVDPSSIVASSAVVEAGSFLAPGVVINNAARVGVDCIINTNASVDHDCVIGAHAQVSPGVCLTGNVSLGEGVMVGAQAVIVPGRKVGRNSVVGAGAVVTRDLPENVLAWGSPARVVAPPKK